MSPRRTPRRNIQPHLIPLGRTLRRAREHAGAPLTGQGLALALGWDQSKVSLLENGRQLPTEDDVLAWAQATGADPNELLAARRAVLQRDLDLRDAARLPGGSDALQHDIENLEAASRTIAEYQPTLVPALVQTPDYTRAWIERPGRIELGGPIDMPDLLATRARRQASARGKAVTVAVQTWALTAVYGAGAAGVTIQRAQLDALNHAAADGAVELVVLPRPTPILHGFELVDGWLILENVLGARLIEDAAVVAHFRSAVVDMRRDGLTGRRALREVERAWDGLG